MLVVSRESKVISQKNKKTLCLSVFMANSILTFAFFLTTINTHEKKNKEITDSKETEEILSGNKICRIALCDNDTPYIVPME
jgi:hypothetical protein